MNGKLEQLKTDRPDLYDRYIKLKALITREGFDAFAEFVEMKTDYIGAPASTKYHLAQPYGLLEHSCNVAENAIMFKNFLVPDAYSDESCALCGLFHDLGKAGHPGKPKYIKNEPTPRQKQYGYGPSVPYSYTKDEGIYLSVPHAAVYYMMGFMKLTVSEWQSVAIHDGQYVDDNKSYACKETPLALILQYADTWAGFVMEPRG